LSLQRVQFLSMEYCQSVGLVCRQLFSISQYHGLIITLRSTTGTLNHTCVYRLGLGLNYRLVITDTYRSIFNLQDRPANE